MKLYIGLIAILLIGACTAEPPVYQRTPAQDWEVTTGYPCLDATVYQDKPDLSLGTTTAQNECIRVCNVDHRVFYMDFDDLPPMNCVQSCSLVLYCTYATGGMPCSLAYDCGPACEDLTSEIGLYEVLEPWEESTITWDTQPAVADSPFVVYISDNEHYRKVGVVLPYWPEYGILFKGISEWVARSYITGENTQVAYFSPELHLLHRCNWK